MLGGQALFEELKQLIVDSTETSMPAPFTFEVVLQITGTDDPLQSIFAGELLFSLDHPFQSFVQAFGKVIGIERRSDRRREVEK